MEEKGNKMIAVFAVDSNGIALLGGMWTVTTTTTCYYLRQLESLPPNTEFSVLSLT